VLDQKLQDLVNRGVVCTLTPRRSCSIRRSDAQAGPEFLKRCRGQAFGHHVGELLRCRDMENAKLSQCDLLSNKMEVDLDVLRASVMDGVGSHVH
jgi:hypothetical protein